MLTHIARHNSVHLAAAIRQSINLMPLHFETHKSLRTKPVHGWSVSREGGGVACGGYMRRYSCGGLVGVGVFFVDPPHWSLNALYAKHGRSRGEDNLSQNGQSHHIQNISVPPAGSGS